MEEAPLGGLSPRVFLRRHWQKRPLLVRRALPVFRGSLGKNALFALATRSEVESRLVERSGKKWRVTHGPLSQSRLRRAGARNWSLLVNGVNYYSAPAEDLLRRFSFIPQARLDDVMVSYAAPGGGVGPHFDSYDVFLIQGTGRRLWRLAKARPAHRPFPLVADAPLKLIGDFSAEEEYLLEPGDLLYLPPGWGHDGVALDACITYSVGFRAAGGAELARAFLDYLHERGFADAAYRDPGLRATQRSGRIGADMLRFAERQLKRVRWHRWDVASFLGRFLSTPKDNVVFLKRRSSAARLRDKLVVLDPKTQLLYLGAQFFINGESLLPGPAQRAVLAELADRRQAPGRRLARAGLEPLLSTWHRAGFVNLDPQP